MKKIKSLYDLLLNIKVNQGITADITNMGSDEILFFPYLELYDTVAYIVSPEKNFTGTFIPEHIDKIGEIIDKKGIYTPSTWEVWVLSSQVGISQDIFGTVDFVSLSSILGLKKAYVEEGGIVGKFNPSNALKSVGHKKKILECENEYQQLVKIETDRMFYQV